MDAAWGIVGVPSSAGAHTPGLEKGPAAIRRAGLAAVLAGGAEDHGDVAAFRWRPDRERPNAKNVGAVARVAAETADAVAGVLARAQRPVVIGGDCSITVGVVAGFVRHGTAPALLYVDGGPDLFTPMTRANGNLDAMGTAHLLGLPGCAPELAGIGPVTPLLHPSDIVSYGDALAGDDDPERRLLDELRIPYVTAAEVHADATTAARRARTAIEATGRPFVLHLDVDVLSFVDVPLADVPDSGGDPAGLTLAELTASLAVLAASPRFAALVLTEINPDHAPDDTVLRDFVAAIGSALPAAAVPRV
ncbi:MULTISPECIES: arginase family protein [Catenuloplanes]|uniref:Arginase n=1 Tax=Catenuloplanes niger TaxID=587534 RepID=A0AAE3ZVG5_9ACTN|nr:arginase family protein [Catenuloplanes niger]MDR7326536.1 arginase [Catenuloplanes niger]